MTDNMLNVQIVATRMSRKSYWRPAANRKGRQPAVRRGGGGIDHPGGAGAHPTSIPASGILVKFEQFPF
jgi:hypothetical protein